MQLLLESVMDHRHGWRAPVILGIPIVLVGIPTGAARCDMPGSPASRGRLDILNLTQILIVIGFELIVSLIVTSGFGFF